MQELPVPVDDHPIHPSTQKGADFRYGCWNREPFADAYMAPQRFAKPNKSDWSFRNFTCSNEDFEIGTVFVFHKMSTDCKYDMSDTDPNCKGCKHRIVDLEALVREDIDRQLNREYQIEFLRRMTED